MHRGIVWVSLMVLACDAERAGFVPPEPDAAFQTGQADDKEGEEDSGSDSPSEPTSSLPPSATAPETTESPTEPTDPTEPTSSGPATSPSQMPDGSTDVTVPAPTTDAGTDNELDSSVPPGPSVVQPPAPPVVCPEDTQCRTYTPPAPDCAAPTDCSQCVAADVAMGTTCADDAGTCDGLGACQVPDKLALGQACMADDECVEGHCVDGVCCDSACDGVCEACGAAGHCDQVPQDDTACQAITCAASSACVSYPAALSADRCFAFNQCHTQATHCVAEYAEPGAECGSGLACDGEGACVSVCEDTQVWCDDACIDPLTDNEFCGATGDCSDATACETGSICVEGECELQCADELVACGDECIDPMTSGQHCGAQGSCSGAEAGDTCSGGEECLQGVCRTWRSSSHIVEDSYGVWSAWIAMSPDGDGLVMWNEQDSDGLILSELWGRVYDSQTRTWGEATLVAEDFATLVAFGEGPGAFVVTWSSYEGQDILSRRFDGSNWLTTTTVDLEYSSALKLGTDGNGRAVLAYTEWDESEEVYNLRTRTWNTTSHTWGPRTLHQSNAYSIAEPTPALDDNGQAFLVWLRFIDTSSDPEVWASRYDVEDAAWTAPVDIGDSYQRQSGYQLVVNQSGDVVAYWNGRLKGKLWDQSEGEFTTLTKEGDYADASICALGNDNALVTARDAGVRLWSRRYNGQSSSFESVLGLTTNEQPSPVLACANGFGFAAWSNVARRWSEATGSWGAEKTFAAGHTAGIAAAANGAVMIARRVDYDDGNTYRYFGLDVEHFE